MKRQNNVPNLFKRGKRCQLIVKLLKLHVETDLPNYLRMDTLINSTDSIRKNLFLHI